MPFSSTIWFKIWWCCGRWGNSVQWHRHWKL